MRNFIPKVLVILCLALGVAASPSGAGTFGGEVFGAMNTYGMQDWNDAIDQANAGGSNFDQLGNGLTGGLGLRAWMTPSWMLQGSWEPLFESTKDAVTSQELDANANSFQVGASFFFPSTSSARYGLGAGLGYYALNGKITDPTSPDVEIKGSTIGFHFQGHGEWTVSPGFAVTSSAGYRVANIDDTEFDGSSASPKFSTDYSGFMGRLGLAFYIPQAK
jgi:outer membrane protein with beta-barrel domain